LPMFSAIFLPSQIKSWVPRSCAAFSRMSGIST
jgi:hypothetical protein